MNSIGFLLVAYVTTQSRVEVGTHKRLQKLSVWPGPNSRIYFPGAEYVSGLGGGCRGVNQAYSRLSTTHDHITDCKLDSVVHAGVGVVI